MRIIKILLVLLLPITATAQQQAGCSSDAHAEFDFWVGQWQVTANGKPAGNNTISKIENGCVVRENWSSATSAYTGTSYNFYNQTTEQWEQLWLDNQGGFLKLAGTRKDNQMILQAAPAKNEEGAEVIQRITWTANQDGTVRQLWEALTAGKDPQIAFDGLYKKAE